jgi:multidrug efflux pump subunit AcrB
MKSVVRFSIGQTVFINVVFVILVLAGGFSLFTIPVENMPTVDMGQVFVTTVWYGASADDVEQLVTAEIEDALDSLEEVEYIKSDSYRNFSSILVKFNDDIDYRRQYDELRFLTLNIKSELPPGADEPRFLYIDTKQWLPVVVVNLTGDLPQKTLKLFADQLKSRIIDVPGVQTVEIDGEFEREFHLSLDPERLRAEGVVFEQVVEAVRSANTRIPTGRFRQGEDEFNLDAGRRLSSQQEVLDVIVRRDGDGNFVRVRDLAVSARMHHRDPTVIPSVNGEDTLRLRVLKSEAGNAIDISTRVKEIARDFVESHAGEGLGVVFTNDSTIEINESVSTLGGNLVLGLALVTLVLWVTLGFRNALLTAVGVPFAFLCSIIIMKLAGVSLNTISLFAFVLVTGIMVDDAVIIMENVFRHLQMGKDRACAVVDGTAEVFLPVVSSAVTTILAFLPMLIMTGSTGEFFAQIPKTVTYALVASLFEALFILPIHILDWGPRVETKRVVTEDEDPFHHLRRGIFAPLWKIYRVFLTWLLDHKVFAFLGIGGLFLASVLILVLSVTGIFPLIDVQFFPGNYFRYRVTVAMPSGTPIEITDGVVRDLSRFIAGMGPGAAQSASGSAGFYEDQDYARHTGSQYGDIVVTLPDKRIRDFPRNPSNDPIRHLAHMREALREFAAHRYAGSERVPAIKVFEEPDGPPTGKPVNIRVTAARMDDAVAASDRLLAYLRETPEFEPLVDLDDDRAELQRIVRYIPRQEAVSEFGLSPGRVTAMAAGALRGENAGRFRSLDEEVDLLVRIARRDDPVAGHGAGLADPRDILGIPVVEDAAAPILLRDLMDAEFAEEPSVRTRYKGRPTITLTADIRSEARLSPARVQFLVERFDRAHRDEMRGTTLSYGGEFDSTSRSYASLTFAFFIAVLLIYMVLSSQFNHYVQPIIIITAVPFALIGVVMGLFLTRTTFTIGSFMAIVGLAGVAVNDSLLLIDFMNKRYRNGRSLRDAVIEASAARMRPVLITTVTTILGLLPMAIGIPDKSISWAPMATAFVSGLASATILALLMIPVEYEAFERIRERVRARRERRKASAKTE